MTTQSEPGASSGRASSGDAAGAPITNGWGAADTVRPEVDHVTIHRSEKGAAYNHHPQLTSLDGRLYATWSCGERDEDIPGQRMMLSVSDDGGKSWSSPRVLAAPDEPRGVGTAMGIHVHEGRMVAYLGHYEMSDHGMLMYYATGGNAALGNPDKPAHLNPHTRLYVCDDAGETWRGPVATIDGFVPNLAPSPLADGRLILPGNVRFPCTDDPAGVEGWTMAGLPRIPEKTPDDPEGHLLAAKARGDEHQMCEASFFQTDDETVHMMMRTTGGRLAVSESRDRGQSWSEPAMTDYTDCACRHHFGRLPDGRFFGLNCPEPRSQRTPMVLATGTDGARFDRHYILGEEAPFLARVPGVHKYGRYGYPYLHIMGGRAFAIYSVNKEDIAVARFRLDALV